MNGPTVVPCLSDLELGSGTPEVKPHIKRSVTEDTVARARIPRKRRRTEGGRKGSGTETRTQEGGRRKEPT